MSSSSTWLMNWTVSYFSRCWRWLCTGLESLRFLDLSGNQMATIEPGAFTWLVNLRTLHLRSNSLATSQLTPASLRGLQRLQELDVSYNRLQGRLTAAFLQGLEGLKTLDLGVNNVTLLKRGMLSDLKRLTSLRLSYNQVGHSFL